MSTINQSNEDIVNDETMQNELNEINEIDSIEYFISTLSPEEIQSKIETCKEINKSQLSQISSLIDNTNDKVSKLSQNHKRGNVKGNKGSISTYSLTNKAEEVNLLHKEHQKKLKQLEKETEIKLKDSLRQIEEVHNDEMIKINEDHERKVNEYYNKMEHNLKVRDDLFDLSKYITRQEHGHIIDQMKQKYQNNIDDYDKEINRLENTIKDKYSQWINKANHSITQPNTSVTGKTTKAEIKHFISKLKYENGNNNFINLVSQMNPSIEVIEYIDSNEGRASIVDENYYKIDDKDIHEFNTDEEKPIKQILVNHFTIKKCH